MAEALTFNIGADTKGFQDGISGLLGKLGGLVAAFVSAQAVIDAFGQAIDMGGRLHDLATRTGESAGNLALLERAFDNASVGADRLGPAITKMQVGMTALQTESDACKNAFAQLGLTFEDFKGKTPTEQLTLIGERLAGIHDPALRASTAVAIFGRSGTELLPVLLNMGSELREAERQLGSLPALLTANSGAIDSLGDNLSAMRNKLTEMALGFLVEVLPALDAFTSRLAGLDAAGLGATLARSLVGAFVDPMQAVQALGGALVVAAKSLGNELIFQVRYWAEMMSNTFSSLGTQIIPMLGTNMLGAFEIAAGGFGTALLGVIESALQALQPIANMLGFGDQLNSGLQGIQALQEASMKLMSDGSTRIESSADKFKQAFIEAQAKSTVIREDFLGVATDVEKTKLLMEGVQQAAEGAAKALNPDSSELAEGRTTTGDSIDPAMLLLSNENIVKQNSILSEETKKNTEALKTMNQKLSVLADSNPDQLIGKSASAREVESLDQQIKQLQAEGGDPERLKRLQALRATHANIALGIATTESDREAARDYARENLADSDKSYDQLYNEALNDIENRKREQAGLPPKDAEAAKKQAEATTKPEEEESKQTPKSIAQELLKLFQKIEPRIPIANLS
jgi:hypothetical protein